MSDPVEGDIWHERDPRADRFVKILQPTSGWVRLRSCTRGGEFIRGTRVSLVAADKFLKRFDKVTTE